MNGKLLAQPFPMPSGPELRAAYQDLYLAANGDEATRRRIGNPATLPRPWDPSTCTSAPLRAELWEWLDLVVEWLNHEYVWDLNTGGMVPSCWPLHPHLVHEIAVLADQRRRASIDTTSSSLEEWHRYSLPAFVDRLRSRTRTLCDEEHKPWPARTRFVRYLGTTATTERQEAFDRDLGAIEESPRQSTSDTPRLTLVIEDGGSIDPTTGEIT